MKIINKLKSLNKAEKEKIRLENQGKKVKICYIASSRNPYYLVEK